MAALVFLFFGSLLVPGVTAATWAAMAETQLDDEEFGRSLTLAPTVGGRVTHFFHETTNGFARRVCTLGTSTCDAAVSIQSDYFDDGGGDHGHELRYSGTEIFACIFDESEPVNWVYSSDTGGSYATGNVAANGTRALGCGADFTSAGTWLVAWIDDVGDAILFNRSINFGTTWTQTVVATGITTTATNSVSLIAVSTTEFTIAYVTATNTISVCNTTDTGATWACGSTGITSAAFPYLEHSGSTWFLSYATTTNSPRLAKSTNGVIWSTSSIHTDTGTGGRIIFQVVDEDNLYASSNSQEAGPNNQFGYFHQSTDGGATWATEDSCIRVATMTGTVKGGSAVHVTSGGQATAAYVRDLSGTVRVNVCHADVDPPATPAPAGSTRTLSFGANNITGWAIDETGQNLIIRPSTGYSATQNVTSYDAVLFTDRGDEASECNRVDGVLAARDHIAYLACDEATSAEVLTLNLRNINMGTSGLLVEPCPDCQTEIDMPTLLADEDVVGELKDFASFPLTGVTRGTFGTITEPVIAFFFSDFNGNVGVAAKQYRAGLPDREDRTLVSYSADSPDQICVLPRDGDVYLVAVDSAATTRAWKASVSHNPSELESSLTTQWTSGTAGGVGVACSWDKVLVATGSGQIVALNSLTGIQIWAKTGVNVATRGVAVSSDGAYGIYQDASNLIVVDMADGTELGTLGAGSGAINQGLWMDRHACTAWHVTDQEVNLYEVYNLTTAGACVPAGPAGQPDDAASSLPGATTGVGGAPAATGGIAGSGAPLDPAIVGASLGTGSFGGGLFLAGIFMLAISIAGGTQAPAGMKLWGGIAGLVVGLLMSWGFGWLNTVAVFSIVFFIAAGLGLKVYASKGG